MYAIRSYYGLEQVERPRRWDEHKVGVLDLAFDAVVQRQPRLVERVADMVVEFLVLLVGDLVLRITSYNVCYTKLLR